MSVRSLTGQGVQASDCTQWQWSAGQVSQARVSFSKSSWLRDVPNGQTSPDRVSAFHWKPKLQLQSVTSELLLRLRVDEKQRTCIALVDATKVGVCAGSADSALSRGARASKLAVKAQVSSVGDSFIAESTGTVVFANTPFKMIVEQMDRIE